MADVQKSAFMLSSATIMLAPAFTTSVFDLNPREHSVGMVGDVNIATDSTVASLKNGIAQATVDSKRTGLNLTITGDVYEMTAANFLRSQGISKTPVQMRSAKLVAVAGANANSISLISDPLPGEPLSALTAAADIPAGSTLLIQRPAGEGDYVFPTKTTAAATLVNGVFTVPILAIPAIMTFPVDSKVWLVQEAPIASIDADELFGLKVTGVLTQFNRPVVYIAPKVRIVKGFSLNFSATQYTSMNWEIQPLLLTRAEASTGRLSEIGNRQLGVLFSGTGGYSEGSTPTPPPPTPTVSISADTSQNESSTVHTYTITRSDPTGAVTVPYSFAQGSTNAADYPGGVLPTGGSVTMANGVSSGSFTITVNNDTDVEPNETFTVSLSAPSGYALGTKSSATGTIINDDTGSLVAPLAPSVVAYNGDKQVAFDITDNPSSQQVRKWGVYEGTVHGGSKTFVGWFYRKDQLQKR